MPSTIATSGSGLTVTTDAVKVPNWILSDTTLEVVFNERATKQIDEFQINRVRHWIIRKFGGQNVDNFDLNVF